jgi:hypothetical protein
VVSAKPVEASVPLLAPGFLWAGSWESNGKLSERFDFTAKFPGPDLALRFQLLDQRAASSWEIFRESFGGDEKTIITPGAGIYHGSTGSRVLYGTLDIYGLAARIRNIWTRGAPYTDTYESSHADLKTGASSTAVSQAYVYLGSPDIPLGWGKIRGFSSLAFDGEGPAISAGTEYSFAGKKAAAGQGLAAGQGSAGGQGSLVVEGFYSAGTLAARGTSSWFSEEPALPERNFRLMAGTAALSLPAFDWTVDLACSETFAYGRDYYGSLGLRFGNRPWRFFLSMDGAGDRFVDSRAVETKGGLRFAARLERQEKRSGLFRLSLLFRGPEPERGLWNSLGAGDFISPVKGLNRSSLDLYYRLPASSTPLGLERVSLSLDRDGREADETLDSANILGALRVWALKTISQAAVSTVVKQGAHEFKAFKISQNLSWTFHGGGPKTPGTRGNSGVRRKHSFSLGFSANAAYENAAGKADVWTASASVLGQGRRGRLRFMVSTPDFPRKWKYTLSWRMQF